MSGVQTKLAPSIEEAACSEDTTECEGILKVESTESVGEPVVNEAPKSNFDWASASAGPGNNGGDGRAVVDTSSYKGADADTALLAELDETFVVSVCYAVCCIVGCDAYARAGFLCDESEAPTDKVDAAADVTPGIGPYGNSCVLPLTRTFMANERVDRAALTDAFLGSNVEMGAADDDRTCVEYMAMTTVFKTGSHSVDGFEHVGDPTRGNSHDCSDEATDDADYVVETAEFGDPADHPVLSFMNTDKHLCGLASTAVGLV